MRFFGVLVIVFAIVLGISIFYSRQFDRNDRFKLAMVSLAIAGFALVTLIITNELIDNVASLLIVGLSIYLVIKFFQLLNHKHSNGITKHNISRAKHLLRSQKSRNILSSMRKTIITSRAMTLKILGGQGRIKTSDYQNKQIKNILDNANEKDLNNAKRMAKITIKNLNKDSIKKIQKHLDKHQNN